MRWDALRADGGPEAGRPDHDGCGEVGGPGHCRLPIDLPTAVTRVFDTPEFAGTTFYEIRAKSILNRVPPASRMGFEWTVNPYRGCTHACVYCLAGDTPVLTADGGVTPLAGLRVGDAIRGTVRDGSGRRLVTTRVLAQWSLLTLGYRVVLDDGTELTAGGDHRFLADDGWRFVTDSPVGRPHLVPGTRLYAVGPGRCPGPARTVTEITPLAGPMQMFDITTGTGDFVAGGVVSHNCFARNTHTYLDLDAGHDFDSRVVVKVNAGELLRRELAAPRWSGAQIAMGTNVDCYQRAEGRYRLMREILAALRDFANPFSILTKGTLILRDLDLLRQAAEVTSVGVSFSIGFTDERLWRSVEPGTPSPARRLDAVRRLADAGFAVGVLMAPVLPGLSDAPEQIDATVAAIAAAGAASVVPIALHLRPGAREWYAAWLAREYPHLLDHYQDLYGERSYLPRDQQDGLAARVRMAARRHGLRPAGTDGPRHAGPDGRPAGSDGRRPARVATTPEEHRAFGGVRPGVPPVEGGGEQLSLL